MDLDSFPSAYRWDKLRPSVTVFFLYNHKEMCGRKKSLRLEKVRDKEEQCKR